LSESVRLPGPEDPVVALVDGTITTLERGPARRTLSGHTISPPPPPEVFHERP
jgi:hypothetical protein